MGIPSYIVAAPEGFWVYEMDFDGGNLVEAIPGAQVQNRSDDIRDLLLSIRNV